MFRALLSGGLIGLALAGRMALAQEAVTEAPPDETAPAEQLVIELNKLEDRDGTCRAYFVLENQTPNTFSNIRLDVFLFDENGVIESHVILPMLDIPAAKTRVSLVDIPQVTCGAIRRVLINDVPSCETEPALEPAECIGRLDFQSRTDIVIED